MTVKDLEQKRDALVMVPGKEKDLTEAVYNVGIAISERLEALVKMESMNKYGANTSMFEQIFGKQ